MVVKTSCNKCSELFLHAQHIVSIPETLDLAIDIAPSRESHEEPGGMNVQGTLQDNPVVDSSDYSFGEQSQALCGSGSEVHSVEEHDTSKEQSPSLLEARRKV